MERVEKVATPFTADTVVVPDSVPPPGLVPIATVMLAVELVTVLPNASCTATCTAGERLAPAGALLGWTRNASAAATGGITVAVWVALRLLPSTVAVAVSVNEIAWSAEALK